MPAAAAHKVLPARVWRFYRGGLLLEQLRGEADPQDGEFPEDWVASTALAHNPGREEPNAGLARLQDGRLLRDAIAADPAYWLGEEHAARYGPEPGVLVKLLDPAQRLPVHAHPEAAFAQREAGSRFGKTEAWIVLQTRSSDARVWVGLREDVDAGTWRSWIEQQDTEAMLGALNEVPVTAGDVIYVPAGVPHAIGGGMLIAELQEPTDLLILCEHEGFPIDADQAHLGIGWDRCMQAFDLTAHTPVRELAEVARSFFWADHAPEPAGRFAVLLVTAGRGTIDGQPARPGDAFVLPAALRSLQMAGELDFLRCLGPQP